MAYTTNLGNQQVTIYPYQTLTSYHANQLLYGLFEPGIYDGEVTIHDGGTLSELGFSSTQIVFKVSSGTTLVFKKSSLTPEGTKQFIGKIVFDADAYVPVTKQTVFKTGIYLTAQSLTLVADWNYNLSNSSERYVEFSVRTNNTKNSDINAGKLVIAEFLNHQYFVQNCGIDPNGIFPSVNIKNYQKQTYKFIDSSYPYVYKPLKRLNDILKSVPVSFDENGTYVNVGPVTFWNSDTLIYFEKTSIDFPGRTTLPSGWDENDYHQVDVLRLKQNEYSNTTFELVWNSFLLPNPASPFDFTDISNISQQKIIEYISGYEFKLYDPAIIILFAVRKYTSISITGTQKVWPGQCFIPDVNLFQLNQPEYFTRWKLPIYNL